MTVVLRRATADTELAGVAVAAGSDVGLLLGAANHDERRWDDPDRFDVLRPARAHVAFGFGIHACLGMHLARMETRIALECLLDRLPGLRLDPDPGMEVAIRGLSFRSPIALPVRF